VRLVLGITTGFGGEVLMSDSRMMVMVASLERHLQEERKILNEAIVGQQGLPVGLAYPAIPANYIFKLNLQCISDADYVVLLLGSEYGALTDKGVGYIHATYAAAQAARKPIISLIYNGAEKSISDSFDQKRLQGLVDLLKPGIVYYWNNADSLRDCAERALEQVFETYPSVGWIKADLQPLVPEISQDEQSLIHKLKSQVSQLKRKLHSTGSSEQDEDIALSKDSKPWTVNYQCNAFREGRLKQFEGHVNLTIPQIFEWLSPSLLSPVTEARLRAVISSKLHDSVLKKAQATWKGCHAVSDVKVEQNSFDELKMRLRSLNVISFDSHGRWQLTQGGEKIALQREPQS
jgi:hypothetical protein